MTKVVVTGGTGFIGSHLVKSLVEQGKKVIVVSDFARLGTENLVDLGLKTSDMELRKADLTDYSQTLKVIEGADVVYHLAARVGSLEYLHSSEQAELSALQTNLVIDANVFKACLERGVHKIIYASSCAVYPMDRQFSPGAIFSEADLDLTQSTVSSPQSLVNPADSQNSHSRLRTQDFGLTTIDSRLPTIYPDGGYGWAKVIGEIQLNWMKGIDIGIARIFNVYGENEPLGERAHVVGDLIQKAILYQGGDFIIRGDGNQTRDFLYVSDCIEALLKLKQKLSNSTTPMTINIGSGKPTTIRTTAEKVVKLSGRKVNIIYNPTKAVGPISRTADITKAKALLGWEPKVSLDEGLRYTYYWVEKKISS
jgi:nucleoside-diphosphate-sugar epimerase